MKKTIAVLLAAIMLLASLAVCFAAFADDVNADTCIYCGNKHSSTNERQCTCCLSCPYLDLEKVAGCRKNANGVTNENPCCDQCTGFYDCTCGTREGCTCKFCNGKGDEPQPEMKPVIDEQSQLHIREIFQSIIKKISEVFDRMFEVAFAVFNIK